MDLHEISKLIKEKTGKDNKVKGNLFGGMSNLNYIVEIEDKNYIFRVPGQGANNFVDREMEKDNLKTIESRNFAPKPIYFDTEVGYKLTPYVEGNPLSTFEEKPYKDVSEILKKLHSGPKFSHNYGHLDRLNYYESIHNNRIDRYYKLKDQWINIYEDILSKSEMKPCHGDAQTSNFLLGDRLYLMDWEFAGNNDPTYDIACFGNANFNEALELLKVYFENPSKEEYLKLYGWRMYQCLQWFNVASYKDEIGLSKTLKLDFKTISDKYLDKAEGFYQDLKKL